MLLFVGLTIGLLVGLAFAVGYAKRDEVKANWSQYHADLLYMIAAPMFKPDDDPRSPAQFAADNFSDVVAEKVQQLFAVLMEPIYKIFGLVTNLLVDTLNGLFNIKSLLGNMWKKWNSMTDIFTRRYYAVFNQLRMTFQKLNMAIGRVFGVATASIYSALSVIDGIRSFIDLMVIVVLVILGILIAMIFFLWFVLFPSIPLILTVIGIVVVAGAGAAAGMSDSFCFKQGTLVATAVGPVPIEAVTIGTELATGGYVKGVMEFVSEANYDLYDLYGVQVSGSHIVYDTDGTPVHVSDHRFSYHAVQGGPTKVYCLITSDQKIPVVTPRNGTIVFADWEELENDADLQAWHHMVQEMLNGESSASIPEHVLASEAVFSERTRIWTPVGVAEIRGIRPGDTVMDADGRPTRVTGVVKMSSCAVAAAEQIGHNAYASAGAWIRTTPSARWQNPSAAATKDADVTWYSLFTEAGTFKLCEDIRTDCVARDFSDVGSDRIQTSYGWVLEALKSVA